jgi:hypothetical protein
MMFATRGQDTGSTEIENFKKKNAHLIDANQASV